MVPFPTSISNSAFTSFGIPGPFLIGAARYVVLQGLLGTLRVFKSIDSGQTWVEKDAGGAPTGDNSAALATTTDGAGLLFSVFLSSGSGNMLVSIFSTVSDTWVSTTVCSATVVGSNSLSVCYRPDKTLVVGSQVSGGPNHPVASYFTFDTVAKTFSAWITIGNNPASPIGTFCYGVLRGFNRTVFYIAQEDTFSGTGIRSIYQQCLTDAGVLGAVGLVDTINDAGNSFWYAAVGSSASVIALAWFKTSLGPPEATAVLQAPVIDNDLLVFASQTVSVTAGNTVDSVAMAVGTLGTYFFVANYAPGDGPPDTIQYALDGGAGFGPLVTLGTIPESALNLWGDPLEPGNVGLVMTGVVPSLLTAYWETAAVAPPVVPIVVPLQFIIFPFPWGPDCCDPCKQDVCCVIPSSDGSIYVPAKTTLARFE